MFQLFHVLNRGVDKRIIFSDKQDHLRFIHDLFELNDSNPSNNNHFSFHQKDSPPKAKSRPNTTTTNDIGSRYIKRPRKLLVDILAFCLMPNHYHLLLSPKSKNGIPKFMQKLNIGYAKYFNQKYKRTGTLFEGRYKSILINEEQHFLHLPYYIHCNPLDLTAPEWRENRLADYKNAKQFLENYRWSSHLDYIGKTNFPSVTNRSFLLEIFGGEEEYQKSLYNWLQSMTTDGNLQDVLLE